MINGFSERLHRLRVASGMSQKQFSDRLNMSPSIVSGYETGERTPSTEVLLAISNLLHCSTDYLLGKSQVEPAKVIDVDGLSDKQIQAVRNLVNALRE